MSNIIGTSIASDHSSSSNDGHLPSIGTSGRYLSHVEDEPMLWQRRFDDVADAVHSCRDLVADRRDKNGGGDGIVIDTLARKVVCAFDSGIELCPDYKPEWFIGIPYSDELQEAMVDAALAHETNIAGNLVPFIWKTS